MAGAGDPSSNPVLVEFREESEVSNLFLGTGSRNRLAARHTDAATCQIKNLRKWCPPGTTEAATARTVTGMRKNIAKQYWHCVPKL
jgi:hypothetical protein